MEGQWTGEDERRRVAQELHDERCTSWECRTPHARDWLMADEVLKR